MGGISGYNQGFVFSKWTELEKQLKEVIAGKKAEIGIAVLNAKGQLIGINDVGFVHLPNGQRYTIAVFVKDSEESASSTAQIISDISQVIYQYVEQGD